MSKEMVPLYYCGRCGEFYRARKEIVSTYRLCLRCGKQMMKLGAFELTTEDQAIPGGFF